eukprot:TRINITY_DN6392_c0_g1_i2.p1 TRINITY_DN6392_c0_g1~~TRINITY_DN6392_c0_g1_i2.p1  ORF type:complete len:397 (-),score=81.12 TRINITY_DN6392_c0_g1_i2:188-1378(-)
MGVGVHQSDNLPTQVVASSSSPTNDDSGMALDDHKHGCAIGNVDLIAGVASGAVCAAGALAGESSLVCEAATSAGAVVSCVASNLVVEKVLFQSSCKTRTVSVVSCNNQLFVLKEVSRDLMAFSVENTESEVRILQHINNLLMDCSMDEEKKCEDSSISSSPGCNSVCRLLDVCEDDRFLKLLLEYVPQGDLFEYVAANGALSEDAARHVMLQLLDVVEWLHKSAAVCHLDISLENILLERKFSLDSASPSGSSHAFSDVNIKLCDFGMARIFPEGNSQFPESRISRAPGKLMYMAPEVYEQRSFCGQSADVYSIGVCFFIMLLACPPYNFPSARRDFRFKAILDGKLLDLCKSWKIKSIPSADALDLISRMICLPHCRWSISQLRNHPWFHQMSS